MVPYRRATFGQYVLSIKGSEIWNKLPVVVRECQTHPVTHPSFKNQLKQWLKIHQNCNDFFFFFCCKLRYMDMITVVLFNYLYVTRSSTLMY